MLNHGTMHIFLEIFIFLLFYIHSVTLDDVLLPYSNRAQHEDTRRTHRYVRNCQPIVHGNRTHESIKPIKTSNSYVNLYIKHGREYGHRTIIKNPIDLISVLEPSHPGSCKNNVLTTVADTAEKQHCEVAMNAGFFNPNIKDADYGKCIGNIISNGRVVQDSHGIQNAVFGIRKDGTVVIGYLSEDEMLDKVNPFVQLINGVGWVLRKGENYLNESAKAECKESETTGTLHKFFGVKAGRSLIGVDANGHVHLVQFDGKTWESGVDLNSAAEYMKSVGIINAINFDGGGSATYVMGSNVVNYPSSECPNKEDGLCARNVSSIICVNGGISKSDDSAVLLDHCCNRNYLVVIGMTVIFGISLLFNVIIWGHFMAYRSRFLVLSGANQKKEALQSLLDQNGHYSTCDDDSEDEIS